MKGHKGEHRDQFLWLPRSAELPFGDGTPGKRSSRDMGSPCLALCAPLGVGAVPFGFQK